MNDKKGGILSVIKKLVDKHIPYIQLGTRDELSTKGLKNLDCSEIVAIALQHQRFVKL